MLSSWELIYVCNTLYIVKHAWTSGLTDDTHYVDDAYSSLNHMK